MSIERYDVFPSGCYGAWTDTIESQSGEWVKYEDHKAKVEQLEKELAELKERYRWRDVEEELPEQKGKLKLFLCDYGNGRIETNFLHKNWKYYFDLPIRWMPLPEPTAEQPHPLKKLAENQNLPDPEASKILNDNFHDLVGEEPTAEAGE